jgi:hypothetical protein
LTYERGFSPSVDISVVVGDHHVAVIKPLVSST